jgi:hypothetical protein
MTSLERSCTSCRSEKDTVPEMSSRRLHSVKGGDSLEEQSRAGNVGHGDLFHFYLGVHCEASNQLLDPVISMRTSTESHFALYPVLALASFIGEYSSTSEASALIALWSAGSAVAPMSLGYSSKSTRSALSSGGIKTSEGSSLNQPSVSENEPLRAGSC